MSEREQIVIASKARQPLGTQALSEQEIAASGFALLAMTEQVVIASEAKQSLARQSPNCGPWIQEIASSDCVLLAMTEPERF
jgi:hypothetical protein